MIMNNGENIDVLKANEQQFSNVLKPLNEASTLPPDCYTSDEFFDLEVKEIFTKEWVSVGRVDMVENVGDYYTLELLGEPLVVCRDEDGDIQCMSRVCRHRAAEVVEAGQGNTRRFQCRYHFWNYDLTGKLVGAPEMGEARNFDKEKICLPRLQVEVWEGFIFVNFDPDAEPLAPRLASVSKYLKNYRLGELKSFIMEDNIRPFNWKLMMDNFMEFYHVLGLHSGSHDPMPAELSKAEEYNDAYVHSWGHIPGAMDEYKTLWSPSGAHSPIPPMEGLSEEELQMGQFYLVYPHTLFFLTPEIVGYYRALPQAPGQIRLTIFTLYRPETVNSVSNFEASRQTAEASLSFINSQDMWACMSMQRCFQSPLTQRDRIQGRLSSYELPVNNIARYVLNKVCNGQLSS